LWCEQSLYEAIERGEYLDGNTISKYWCKARDRIYGDSVIWSEDMKWEWANSSYYCYPNLRFLNYHYTLCQLFVYAIYQDYKQDREEFIPKFSEFLIAGGSKSPEELAKIFNFDLNGLEIWNLGMNQYKTLVGELEELTD
jgi:oligoendopeptidase F